MELKSIGPDPGVSFVEKPEQDTVELVDVTSMDSGGWAEKAVAPVEVAREMYRGPTTVKSGATLIELDGAGKGRVVFDGQEVRHVRKITLWADVNDVPRVVIERYILPTG